MSTLSDTLVFTICSNNYLAHAKSLGDSLQQFHPELRFIIGLVDLKDPAIDYDFFEPYELLPMHDLQLEVFNEMQSRYNIIELNTAVKPFYIEYLFATYPDVEKLYYIDPDITFFRGLEELDGLLDRHNIVLTPHLTQPTDYVSTDELVAMRHGHYNLGFIALKRSAETMRFVKWWQIRLKEHCIIDKPRGLFVDQKWVNLAPLYFDGIYNFKHQGYNMAWWNMAERKLLEKDGEYFVNDYNQPLVFFHFSGYKPGSTTYFGRTDVAEYSLENRKDLVNIFNHYAGILRANNYGQLWNIKPLLTFGNSKAPVRNAGIRKKIKHLLKKAGLR